MIDCICAKRFIYEEFIEYLQSIQKQISSSNEIEDVIKFVLNTLNNGIDSVLDDFNQFP